MTSTASRIISERAQIGRRYSDKCRRIRQGCRLLAMEVSLLRFVEIKIEYMNQLSEMQQLLLDDALTQRDIAFSHLPIYEKTEQCAPVITEETKVLLPLTAAEKLAAIARRK